ncbi:hypothetical protein KP509_28G062100 [Ceratopteris richardii]|nr:hypothetical protein KP509_28G062100 [Ceratopteris richardii]
MRLSSLLPGDDSPLLAMGFMKQALQVLVATQNDLQLLVPSHRNPLSSAHVRMMEEFLDRSIKLLDVCRDIKGQVMDVEDFKGTLQAVISCLSTKNGSHLHIAQVVRARKAITELLPRMEAVRIEEGPVHQCRSFRFRQRDSGVGDSGPDAPHRWRSWHGSVRLSGHSSGSNSPASQSSRHLQAIWSELVVPRMAPGDIEENLCAAVYAFNVLAIFVLGVLIVALPSLNKTYVPPFVHPRTFLWATPLSQLQAKFHEELKRRSKKGITNGGMWELDQIATIMQRLIELTEDEDCTLGEKVKEEVKYLVKQLKQHVDELDRDLAYLYTQLMDFYNRIISSRMEVMDMLSKFKP